MPTNPIDYFTAQLGSPPWTTLSLTWDGTGSEFTLFQVGNSTSLYVGDQKSYTFTGQPDTRYDFQLETSTVTGFRVQTLTAYTSPLPAPSGFQATFVDESAITLQWQPVAGATSYEVADVTNAYAVVYTGAGTSVTFTPLTANQRYAYAIRTVLGDIRSRWSRPVTQFTSVSPTITPGVYEYVPSSASVWAAGRPGSSDPAWLSATSDYTHGDGWVWGDVNGIHTTLFFYGSPNPFLNIVGATPTRFQVYVRRTNDSGDPAAVLSQWGLHPYATKPAGDPAIPDTVYDVGVLARGDDEWVDLPPEWASALITNGAHRGLSWGGASGRYQIAPRTGDIVTGTLRITVN